MGLFSNAEKSFIEKINSKEKEFNKLCDEFDGLCKLKYDTWETEKGVVRELKEKIVNSEIIFSSDECISNIEKYAKDYKITNSNFYKIYMGCVKSICIKQLKGLNFGHRSKLSCDEETIKNQLYKVSSAQGKILRNINIHNLEEKTGVEKVDSIEKDTLKYCKEYFEELRKFLFYKNLDKEVKNVITCYEKVKREIDELWEKLPGSFEENFDFIWKNIYIDFNKKHTKSSYIKLSKTNGSKEAIALLKKVNTVFEKLKLKSSSNYRKLNDILTVLSGK